MVVVMKRMTIQAFGMVLKLSLIYSEGQIKLYEAGSQSPISSLFIMTDDNKGEMELSVEDSITEKVIKRLESEHLIQEIPHHYGIFRKFMMLEDFL